jgi:hypothetical protein
MSATGGVKYYGDIDPASYNSIRILGKIRSNVLMQPNHIQSEGVCKNLWATPLQGGENLTNTESNFLPTNFPP